MSDAGYFPLNTTVVKGDDLPYTFYLTDGNDVPLDISSWTFQFTVKTNDSDDDADALFTLLTVGMTVDSGDGTNDRLTFMVPKATSAAWDSATYHQDLEVTRAGVTKTFGKGQFIRED